MGDFVEETVNQVGANQGTDLPKPSEIEALETGESAPAQPTPAPGTEPPAGPPAQPPQPTEVELDLEKILEKAEKGEHELTDDETALLLVEEQKAGEAAEAAKKVYTINGKDFTHEDLMQEIKERYHFGESTLSAKAQEKLVEDYYKSKNKTEFSRTTQQRSMENAAASKANEAEKQRLQAVKIQQDAQRIALGRERQQVEGRIQKLQALAAATITENDITDPNTGMPDIKKVLEFNRKVEAQTNLQEAQTELESLKQTEGEAQEQSVQTQVGLFLAAHPQYKTATDVFTVYGQLSRGEIVDPQDKMKVLEMDLLFREAQQTGVSPEDIFALRKAQGTLAIRDAAQPTNGESRLPLPEITGAPKSVAQRIRAYRARVAQTPTSVPATGGAAGGPAPPSGLMTAKELVDHDAKVVGAAGDDFLKQNKDFTGY